MKYLPVPGSVLERVRVTQQWAVYCRDLESGGIHRVGTAERRELAEALLRVVRACGEKTVEFSLAVNPDYVVLN